MTAKERQAALRDRKRAAGLRPHEVWVHPAVWPAVQRFIREQNDSAPHPTERTDRWVTT